MKKIFKCVLAPRNSAKDDRTDHWIKTRAKQLKQSNSVMAKRMYETKESKTELQ
jgi:hypothetical protein